MGTGPIHILLIEDSEEYVRLLTERLLTSDSVHFLVSSAGTLRQAQQAIRRGGIQVILLDLGLPDSDGLETFIRVSEQAKSIPIVVLSGTQDVAVAIETVQLGAQDYLVKGHVEDHLLIRSLQYAIERKRIQLQLNRAYDEMEVRVAERTTALSDANVRLQREIQERNKAEEAALDSNRQLAAALRQLRSAQSEIIQRERMLALGRMANGIAHDFNNALAPIMGFSELMLLKPNMLGSDPKAAIYLENIYAAAKDSAKVVSRMREFYRYRDKDEHFSPVVINDLIHQVISLTQPRWKDQALAAGINIEVKTELNPIPTVTGNESEIREALAHLVFNAIDAIEKRGTIIVSTEVLGNRVVITVADDGAGMSEEIRAHCLEPFFTTKNSEGTGLGLASVYGAIRRHNGEIDIQSAPQRGTRVTVSLPLDECEAAEEAKPATAKNGALRILVVEDEPLVREVLTVYLDEDKHEIVTANDGREGLEMFKSGGDFDLVLTDRAMPEMNGDALAKAIKEVRPDQRVILLTGFGDLMAGSGEQPDGVDLVVGKPFTLSALRSAISDVMAK